MTGNNYIIQAQAAEREIHDHTLTCPECGQEVRSLPAEGVPDQSLRGCPECGAVFCVDLLDPLNKWRIP